MNNLKIYGVISQIFPQRAGVGSNGKPWYQQDFLLDVQDGNYQKQVLFTLRNTALNDDNMHALRANEWVTVSFDLRSFATQSKSGEYFWRTSVNAWKIEAGDTTGEQSRKQSSGEFTPVFAQSTVEPAGQTYNTAAPQEVQNDLPF